MNSSKSIETFLILLGTLLLISGNMAHSQVNANAGPDITVCKNLTYPIGGSPTGSGGTPPYTYTWSPATGLNNAAIANPILTPNINNGMYIVNVRDAAGSTDQDTIIINFFPVNYASVGNDTSVCFGQSAFTGLASNPSIGVTYSWSPVQGLNNPSSPNPIATVNVSTTYTAIFSSANCPNMTDSMTVTIWPLPAVSAGPDFTINEGDIITLQGSGAATYWWTPNISLFYFTTANPDAFPQATTTYGLAGVDANGCVNYDWVTVTVIPGSKLIFYNTFTPNNDGDNDNYIISNVQKYPNNKLNIYNRFGQLVFSATPYTNNWNGRNLGDELPDATYYYVFDPGDGSTLYYGSVTLIR